MTTRKAKATATANTGVLRSAQNDEHFLFPPTNIFYSFQGTFSLGLTFYA
jgi:hypothetical protein